MRFYFVERKQWHIGDTDHMRSLCMSKVDRHAWIRLAAPRGNVTPWCKQCAARARMHPDATVIQGVS
jgi:hypothetical protein